MTKRQLQNELSKSTLGVKYSKLDEYEQDGINENLQGLKELIKDFEQKIKDDKEDLNWCNYSNMPSPTDYIAIDEEEWESNSTYSS